MIQLLRFIVVSLSVVLGGSILLTLGIYKKPKTFNNSSAIVFFLLLFAVIGGTVGGFDMIFFQQPERAYVRVPSYVTVRTMDGEEIDIRLCWDVLCQQPVTEVDWGDMEQQSTVETLIWIKNAATKDVWLTMNMSDWDPPDADQVLTLRWDWANLNAWKISSGDWAIVTEELHVSATSRNNIVVRTDPGFNYEISTQAKVVLSDGRPEAQILFRWNDENNFYFAGLGAYGYKAAIGVNEAGSARMLASGGNPDYADVVLDQWYDMKVRVAGSTFTVFIDGEEICSVDDTTLGFGGIGLTAIHSDAVFDNFVAVDAFDLNNVIFEDYFVGTPLEVGTSQKVTMFLDADCPDWPDPPADWHFQFDIVITAWDEPPL